jgi:hemerythrin
MSAAVVTHSPILVGFKPIDDLHREFEAILEALNDPAEADYGAHLLALHEHLLRHCDTEEQFRRCDAGSTRATSRQYAATPPT